MVETHRAGFVTILGRPNVGKSTLLNALLGQKIAIVTPKPQTTRDRMVGICPVENGQLIFVDTPGVHGKGVALNRLMTDVAMDTLTEVDAVVLVLDATRSIEKINKHDRMLLDAVKRSGKPAVCVLNKVDKVQKQLLLPLMAHLAERDQFSAIIPMSALQSDGLDVLLREVRELVPEGPPLYDPDEITDKSVRYLVGELIREKLMLSLDDELPYSIAVEVTDFKKRPDSPLTDIDVTIHVERESQKGIVLGRGGERMKEVNTTSRLLIEEMIGGPVFLRVHVRVEPNWTRSIKGMKKLGYSRPSDKKQKKKRGPGGQGGRS